MYTITILLLFLTIYYHSGKCHEIMEIAPVTEINGIRRLWCQFDVKVDCLWRNKTGQPINISEYNYMYVNGQSTDTYNCSITANPKWMRLNDWQCKGIIRPIPLALDPGISVLLQCIAKRTVNDCAWKKDGRVINIIGRRYHYADGRTGSNTTNCSIIIKNVTGIDDGNWTCYYKADEKSSQNLPIVIYQLTCRTAKMSTTEMYESMSPSKVTIASVNDRDDHANSNNGFSTVGLAVALALIVLLFIYTCWHRNRKSKCLKSCKSERDSDQQNDKIKSIDAISPGNHEYEIDHQYDKVDDGYENLRAIACQKSFISQQSTSNTDNDGYEIPITIKPKCNKPRIGNVKVDIHQYASVN